MRIASAYTIGRPNSKIGYFEVQYPHAGNVKSCCLVAYGFQAAILRFQGFNLGPYRSVREVSQDAFEAWFAVSLNAAKSLDELNTGVHL